MEKKNKKRNFYQQSLNMEVIKQNKGSLKLNGKRELTGNKTHKKRQDSDESKLDNLFIFLSTIG